MADLPPPAPSIEFNLSSTGMSKGIAQTNGPQWLVRGELAFADFYLGAHAKNVSSSTADGEAAALIGIRRSLAGFDVGATAAWKRAINPVPGSDVNSLELSGSVAHSMGPFTPRVSIVWSPDDVGTTGHTVFAEAGASYVLAKALVASAAVGRRHRIGGIDYTAWNAGLSWSAYKHFTVDVRYYDTDADAGQPYRARVVAAGRLSF